MSGIVKKEKKIDLNWFEWITNEYIQITLALTWWLDVTIGWVDGAIVVNREVIFGDDYDDVA